MRIVNKGDRYHVMGSEIEVFHAGGRVNLIAGRSRSKAFPSACLFRFMEVLRLWVNYDTVSGEGRKKWLT